MIVAVSEIVLRGIFDILKMLGKVQLKRPGLSRLFTRISGRVQQRSVICVAETKQELLSSNIQCESELSIDQTQSRDGRRMLQHGLPGYRQHDDFSSNHIIKLDAWPYQYGPMLKRVLSFSIMAVLASLLAPIPAFALASEASSSNPIIGALCLQN